MGLRNKDLLTIHDLTVGEVATILDVAKKLKRKQKAGEPHQYLKGKTLAMLFSKASTRTRTSFEVGFWQLGGHPIYLSDSASQIGRGEPIRDTARVLSRMVDGIMIRTFGHDRVEEFAKWSDVPVINALTDLLHPCQVLTDLLTIQEHKGKNLKGLKMAYVGDGNNMTNSLFVIGAILGGTVMSVCPKGWGPDAQIFSEAQEIAKKTGAKLTVTDRVEDAAGYDVAYTDTWVSMGDNTPLDAVRARYMPYQINRELLKKTGIPYVLHCQPAHRGYEITDDVMDDEKVSLIYDEAENRLHAQMAVLGTLISDKNK